MPGIFPPEGARDDGRWNSVPQDEREYSLFVLEFCSAVLDRRPEHFEALESAANHCTHLGYYHDGLALDGRLARLRPRDPGVLYNLACSQALAGLPAAALRTLADAVTHGYANHRHAEKDEDLKSLRGEERFPVLLDRMRELDGQ